MVVGVLGLEQQTPPAASSATEQPFLGSTLLTSNEEGPRKGGLNIVCSILLPGGQPHSSGHPIIAVEKPNQTPACNTNTVLQPGT